MTYARWCLSRSCVLKGFMCKNVSMIYTHHIAYERRNGYSKIVIAAINETIDTFKKFLNLIKGE